MTLPLRPRALAAIPAAALAATVASALLLPGPARAADPAAPALESPANAAATWMTSKLTDGSNASADHGLTADVVMGLAATGTGGAAQKKATDWLAANAAAYIDRGTPGKVFAGGTAKLALVAAIEGRDPKNFGGQDLTKTLLGRLQDNGRFTDDLPNGDGSNQFTQSLAVLALQRSGDLPAKAVDFLAASRCADGGYPLFFKSDPAKCKSHTDSTGLAVQALLGAGRTADAEPALDWLEKQQLADGSFRDNGFGTPPGNSNSTALDVQALAAGGRVEAAGKGITWLKSVQVGCGAATADRGAVGYAEPKADGTALRATAQAVPALVGKSLAQIDGKGAATDLEPIACAPDGGTNGGSGGNGGTDGGGSNGGSNGGTDGGSSGGNGTDGGTTGGTDPSATPVPSPSGDASATGGNASGGAASGGVGGTGDTTGGVGGSGTTGDTSGGVTPSGGLASTGSTALPLAAGAAALLIAGASAVLIARRRRGRAA
ncbi:hypothetical protein AB0B50_27535 [Streptomyces sp. NPDC041068]|uniref:hypothetical protein n=1 Tax=Streptomyces sp. NPDC041068 TaxID=3155130 RepID=UPI0033DCC8C3